MAKKRGRKSTAEMATPRPTASVQSFAPAPNVLESEAAALWRSIIASRAHNYFSPGDLPLLREYCHSVATLIHRSKRFRNFWILLAFRYGLRSPHEVVDVTS